MEKKWVVFNKSGVNISGIQKIWVTRNLMCLMFPAEVHVERWNSTNANFLQTFQQPGYSLWEAGRAVLDSAFSSSKEGREIGFY